MAIPTEKVPAETTSPVILWIYSSPKVGKTTALSLLDNCLIMDLEKGSKYVSALKLNIESIDDITNYGKEIKAAGRPYKYIAIDTVTKMEDMILPLANKMYRNTAMGQKWGLTKDGKIDPDANVLTLPNGAGYLYLREAFAKVKEYIITLAPRIIMCGHLKDKLIGKEGKEVSARDIDLTGKIRNIECASSDAIGYMYRKGNTTMLSFKTQDDTLCGARPAHLRNIEISLVEYVDGKFIHHWDKVYID